jgi:arylsulfatase A-like enzyme
MACAVGLESRACEALKLEEQRRHCEHASSTGYPGYNRIVTRDKVTIRKILKDNGYWTSWFGKDHNTPEFQASQAGPFDQWPTGMGFDYF